MVVLKRARPRAVDLERGNGSHVSCMFGASPPLTPVCDCGTPCVRPQPKRHALSDPLLSHFPCPRLTKMRTLFPPSRKSDGRNSHGSCVDAGHGRESGAGSNGSDVSTVVDARGAQRHTAKMASVPTSRGVATRGVPSRRGESKHCPSPPVQAQRGRVPNFVCGWLAFARGASREIRLRRDPCSVRASGGGEDA